MASLGCARPAKHASGPSGRHKWGLPAPRRRWRLRREQVFWQRAGWEVDVYSIGQQPHWGAAPAPVHPWWLFATPASREACAGAGGVGGLLWFFPYNVDGTAIHRKQHCAAPMRPPPPHTHPPTPTPPAVKIWDLRAPGCQREYESRAAVNTVVLHPNQGELISGAPSAKWAAGALLGPTGRPCAAGGACLGRGRRLGRGSTLHAGHMGPRDARVWACGLRCTGGVGCTRRGTPCHPACCGCPCAVVPTSVCRAWQEHACRRVF